RPRHPFLQLTRQRTQLCGGPRLRLDRRTPRAFSALRPRAPGFLHRAFRVERPRLRDAGGSGGGPPPAAPRGPHRRRTARAPPATPIVTSPVAITPLLRT